MSHSQIRVLPACGGPSLPEQLPLCPYVRTIFPRLQSAGKDAFADNDSENSGTCERQSIASWEDREVRRYREEESSSSFEEGSVPSLR